MRFFPAQRERRNDLLEMKVTTYGGQTSSSLPSGLGTTPRGSLECITNKLRNWRWGLQERTDGWSWQVPWGQPSTKEWANRPRLTGGKAWVTGMDPFSSRLWVLELFSRGGRGCFREGSGSGSGIYIPTHRALTPARAKKL